MPYNPAANREEEDVVLVRIRLGLSAINFNGSSLPKEICAPRYLQTILGRCDNVHKGMDA